MDPERLRREKVVRPGRTAGIETEQGSNRKDRGKAGKILLVFKPWGSRIHFADAWFDLRVPSCPSWMRLRREPELIHEGHEGTRRVSF
jgi:hypothetical protein